MRTKQAFRFELIKIDPLVFCHHIAFQIAWTIRSFFIAEWSASAIMSRLDTSLRQFRELQLRARYSKRCETATPALLRFDGGNTSLVLDLPVLDL